MARSNYVYVAAEANYDGDNVVAAFTVKHECKTWLQRNAAEKARIVTRFPDGGGYNSDRPAVTMSEEEFLAS